MKIRSVDDVIAFAEARFEESQRALESSLLARADQDGLDVDDVDEILRQSREYFAREKPRFVAEVTRILSNDQPEKRGHDGIVGRS